jgi:5-methyltetrahydropteroyltriglutamate--homocysteine methyltransferase
MKLLVDDIGGFPLPNEVQRKTFDEWYASARRIVREGKGVGFDHSLEGVRQVTLDSLKRKLDCGLDVVSYPQHYDMYRQFLDPVHEIMKTGTYVVEDRMAFLPELQVIAENAKELYEGFGERIRLRACVTGPMELYLKEVGTNVYEDVMLMFAETVRRFARASVLRGKYVETEVVCLDEPSFGFQEISANRDVILKTLERAFDFRSVTKQIHLHSSSRIGDVLEVDGVDVVSFEFAASPRNIETISKRMLDTADKWIRVGISRTDIDSIVAELLEKGVKKPSVDQLVDGEAVILKRFLIARGKYGDRLMFTGPDCGLGGWPSQEAAELVLKRTVNAVNLANIR